MNIHLVGVVIVKHSEVYTCSSNYWHKINVRVQSKMFACDDQGIDQGNDQDKC